MTDFTAKNIKKWEVDQTTLGKILGLTPRWVRQLTADNVIKSSGRGKYSVAASVQAYVAWIKAAQQRAPTSDAREAVLLERARSLRLQNDEREHRLVDTEECIAVLDEIVGTYRTELDGLPARLTRDLDDRKQIASVVDAIGNRVCDKFEQRAAELRANGSIAVPIEAEDEV